MDDKMASKIKSELLAACGHLDKIKKHLSNIDVISAAQHPEMPELKRLSRQLSSVGCFFAFAMYEMSRWDWEDEDQKEKVG